MRPHAAEGKVAPPAGLPGRVFGKFCVSCVIFVTSSTSSFFAKLILGTRASRKWKEKQKQSAWLFFVRFFGHSHTQTRHPQVWVAVPRYNPAIPRCKRPSQGANPPSPGVSGHPHVWAAIPRCEWPSPRVGGHPQFVNLCSCGPSKQPRPTIFNSRCRIAIPRTQMVGV